MGTGDGQGMYRCLSFPKSEFDSRGLQPVFVSICLCSVKSLLT
jgi:hypothetical protein